MGGLVFLILMFLLFGIIQLNRGNRMKKCTAQTEGTVTDVRQKMQSRMRGGYTHWATITFSAGGAEYEYFGRAPDSVLTSKLKMAVVTEDAIGKKVPLLYNPGNPAQCCLPDERGRTGKGGRVLLCMSAFFFILLIVLLAIS